MDRSVVMTEGSIWKKIVLFALPVFFGNLFQQLYNTADTLIVGNFLGSNALAAVSSSGSLIGMLIGLMNGTSIGAGVIVAKCFGAKDHEQMHTAVHTIVAFGLAAGVILTVFGVTMAPTILGWMDTPSEVMPNSIAYLRTYFTGSMFFVMYNIFVGILQAVGDSRHPLYFLIASSITNVILDLTFIGVFDMGVMGAALATIISQCLAATLCLIELLRTKGPHRLIISHIGFRAAMLKDIVRYGIPSGVQNSIISLANVVVQANVNSFGAIAMAGVGAFNKVEGFIFLPIASFSLAVATFISQNLGARQYERAKKGANFSLAAAMILSEMIGIAFFIFAPYIMSAFDRNPEVIQIGVDKARVVALFFCLLAHSKVLAAVMRGAGKAFQSMMVFILVWCVLRVTLLTVFIPVFGTIKVLYWVYPITWAISSIIFMFYYTRTDWVHALDKTLRPQSQN